MGILIADIDVHVCRGIVTDTILRVALEVARRKTEPPAKVTGNTDLLRVAGLGLEIGIAVCRRIKLIRRRRDEVRTVRSIGVRHRVNVIAEADTRAVVTAKGRVAVMTNACREFQNRKDAPLILQIEGAVDERAIIDAHNAAVLDRRIILCELEAGRQQMVAELLVELVAESPCRNTKIITGSRRRPHAMGENIIIIFTARDTHLVLGRVIDFHIPDQIAIQIIIVPAIDIESLLLFIECLIAIRVLVRAQIEGKVGCLAQILAKVQIDRIRIQMRRHRIAVSILEVPALILLVLDAPVPSVLTARVRDAVLLTSIATVADAERRLHPRCLLRDDVDDAALRIRSVERRRRAVQHLDTVNPAEILHRRCQRGRIAPRIVLADTIDQKDDVLRPVDVEFIAVVISRRCIRIDRNARHIAQCLREVGVVAALDVLACNHRDICIRLEFLVRGSCRRDDRLPQCMFICRIIRIGCECMPAHGQHAYTEGCCQRCSQLLP